MKLFTRLRNHFLPDDHAGDDKGATKLRQSGERAKSVEAEALQLLSTWEAERREEELNLFRGGTGNFVENALLPRKRDLAHD